MHRTLTVLALVVCLLLLASDARAGLIVYVDPSGMTPGGQSAFTTIQGAVNAASAGGTIIVDAATYNENVLISQSGITLSGAKAGVNPVNGRSGAESILNGTVIVNPTAGFAMDGFTVHANAQDAIATRATNSIITDNIITNSLYYGIEISIPAQAGNPVSSVVTNNLISVSPLGSDIYLIGSPNNTVKGNSINGGYTGIDVYYSDNSTVEQNSVSNTSLMAIRLRGTHNSLVDYNSGTGNPQPPVQETEGSSGNTFIHNFDGVASPVPEPSSYVLALTGLGSCLGWVILRGRRVMAETPIV